MTAADVVDAADMTMPATRTAQLELVPAIFIDSQLTLFSFSFVFVRDFQQQHNIANSIRCEMMIGVISVRSRL